MKLIKSIAVATIGSLAAIYLSNPGAGVVEAIPDNIPFVGNIDEVIASMILMYSLAFFGLKPRNKRPGAPEGADSM